MLGVLKRSTRLVQVRQHCVKSREELEMYFAMKLEEGLKYLEKMQSKDNSKEAQDDLVRSIARTNYLSKYFLYNILQAIAQKNPSFKDDVNFKVHSSPKP